MSSNIASPSSADLEAALTTETAPSLYGAVAVPTLPSPPTLDDSSNFGSDDGSAPQMVPPEAAPIGLRVLRDRVETAVILAVLRRKYRDKLLICAYIVLLVGLTPMCIYMLVEWELFASLYLKYAGAIHLAVQVVNVVLLYLYIATAFHIGALFLAFNVNPLYGNLVVALSAGSLLAVEFVDQVSVYLRLAHFDERGFYYPTPASNLSSYSPNGFRGTSPDNSMFVVMAFVALFALFMAVLNALHALYYEMHYRNTLNASLSFSDSDGEP